MGSPLAPALCSAAALFREYCFLRSFPTSSWRYATGLALRARYVDNVFFLGPTHMLHTDSFQAIAQPFFYGRPLEMEYVTDETLLGFVLSTSQRTITFRQPPHLTLIRSNRTAGSPDMALAGFFTRGILICRLTRPRDLIFPQLIDLTQQYLDKDFTMAQLLPLLHQLCHRFHLPRRPLHTQLRFLTFSLDAALETRYRLENTPCIHSDFHHCCHDSSIVSSNLHLLLFFSFTSLPCSFSAQTCVPHPFFYISTMSQSTTSDLVSTIATQLNIVIVALRLLVDMIQNPDAASPANMTPGSCPSRPPASPASPLFQTTTRPSISWAPCEQPVPLSELSQTLSRAPSPSPTSSAGKRTPPAPPFAPPLHLLPLPPPLSPPLLLFPPTAPLLPPPPA